MDESNGHPKRVIAYIDGFNLYFGLKESGWQRYYWLDVHKLAELQLPQDTVLVSVKYFTAPVKAPEDKRKRQSDYLEALETLALCRIIRGKYQFTSYFCKYCFGEDRRPSEKMTDVNIAVEMMMDAFEDNCDIALMISGDSDLTPPINAIHRLFQGKHVFVAFPPKRHSVDLEKAAIKSHAIRRVSFRDSQLPDEIQKSDGYKLKRPEKWR